jgi:PKD domain-containing protein
MRHDSRLPHDARQRLGTRVPLLSRACFAVAALATALAGWAGADTGPPRYFNYSSPPGSGDDAGEPSIGINWTTEQSFANSLRTIPNGGTVNYFGGFLPYMLKVTFNDCASPAAAQWEQKPLLTANSPRVFGDPILYTDKATGRTFVSQLEGLTPLGSTTDVTDDDGSHFMPSEGSGLPSCVDHQTFGGGPYHTPLTSPLYPNAVYYCSQCVGDATCSLSLDGGLTFLPGVVAFTYADCVGLHGHIKVGPDGTAYIPNKGCGGSLPFHDGGTQGVVVSEDNGTTWHVRPVTTSTSHGLDQEWDPSVAIATDGSVYFGYRAADGRARVAVSHDRGLTWVNDLDVGAALGIKRIAFPAMVAGDGGATTGRAALAYYGTTTDGNDTGADFPGVWYLYISSTFDGGQTWTTVNATPGDPIQRGGICHDGSCRNMLDFMDAGIDKEGRVLVGWDDGCIGGCVSGPPNSYTAKATITRQCGGKRMYAAFDPSEPSAPEAPVLSGSQIDATVHLTWAAPDHGGAPITEYRLYRRTGAGQPFSLIATVSGTEYTDTINPAEEHAYRLTASNSQGEGPYCGEFVPATAAPTACLTPGIKVINDLNPDFSDADAGQNTPPDGSVNVRQLYVAEPYVGPGVNKLFFRMNVAPSNLPSPPPNSQWFIIWNRLNPDADFDRRYVAMRTDAAGSSSFEYGNFGVPIDPTNPNPNGNTPVMLGAADAGSYDQAAGVITIELSNTKAENIQAGQSLVGVNVRTYLNRPGPGQRSQNNASDITGESSYDLVGNASCFCTVNGAPVAALSAAPTSGSVPLTVHFDASSSSDPNTADGDAVGSYTFSFGDGSAPVTQAGATISHTYSSPSGPSGYFATLTVNDLKCGRQSFNVASQHIEVTSATGVAPPERPVAFGLAPISNPSRGQAFLVLALDRDGVVNIQAFGPDGRRVAKLMDSWMPAGRHSLHWRGLDHSGKPVPPGVYAVRAQSGDRVAVTRIVMLQR